MQLDFQQLIEKYSPPLFWLAYGYCLNPADVEDVLQEVFLSYLQHPPDCEGEAQLRAWLMTATANRCKNLLNSGWRRKTLPLEDSYVSPEHVEEVFEVHSALENLPPNLRGVVHLYYFEQMPVKEIAGLLHLSETAVHSRLFQARKKLKKLLGGE